MIEDFPLQPIIKDEHGTVRFQKNALVSFVMDWATEHGMTMNDLALIPFFDMDRAQFAQLIGYSVSGYGELPYVSEEEFARADEAAEVKWPGALPVD